MIGSSKTWNTNDDRRHPAGQCLEVPTAGIVIERAGLLVEHGRCVYVAPFDKIVIDDDDLQNSVSIGGAIHESAGIPRK